jgi:hypothetical protein
MRLTKTMAAKSIVIPTNCRNSDTSPTYRRLQSVPLEKEFAGHSRNIGSRVAFLFSNSELIHF